jgi:hypothetical protein
MKEYTLMHVGKEVGFREYRQIWANLPFIPEDKKIFMLNHSAETHNKSYKVPALAEHVNKIVEIQDMSNAGRTYSHRQHPNNHPLPSMYSHFNNLPQYSNTSNRRFRPDRKSQ